MNIQRNDEGKVTVGLPARYRFTDGAGKTYAPFRLKAGAKISDVIAEAFPGEEHQTDWSMERA